MIGDTREALVRWGSWTRAGGDDPGTGYKSPMLLILRHAVGGVVGLPPVGDEFATKIDRIIARLRINDREQYEVLRLYYVNRLSRVAISRQIKLDRRAVERVLESAEHWIDGVLSGHQQLLAG